MNPTSGGGLLGWLGITDLLNTQAAYGYGVGLATKSIEGRSPGTEQFQDPTTPPRGTVGQTGTTPALQTSPWQQAMPWIITAGALLVGAFVLKLLFGGRK